MPTPLESKAALRLLTTAAVSAGTELLSRIPGTPEVRRALLLDLAPEVISYYADGSAALAADFYDDERLAAQAPGAFSATPVVLDRTVKVRRAVAWAADPLFEGLEDGAGLRLAEVIQLEVARPYRDTITANRRRDAAAVGWRRITSGGCKFCRMLADRGAVYKQETARFAAHENCHCTAQPVFVGDVGEEASVMQYMASRRNRTPAQKARLTEYLDEFYS